MTAFVMTFGADFELTLDTVFVAFSLGLALALHIPPTICQTFIVAHFVSLLLHIITKQFVIVKFFFIYFCNISYIFTLCPALTMPRREFGQPERCYGLRFPVTVDYVPTMAAPAPGKPFVAYIRAVAVMAIMWVEYHYLSPLQTRIIFQIFSMSMRCRVGFSYLTWHVWLHWHKNDIS